MMELGYLRNDMAAIGSKDLILGMRLLMHAFAPELWGATLEQVCV